MKKIGSIPAKIAKTLKKELLKGWNIISDLTKDGRRIVHHPLTKRKPNTRKAYAWEKKGLTPMRRHPRRGTWIESRRNGRHACQHGHT